MTDYFKKPKDFISPSQGERMGLSFTVEGTNCKAYRLVNGLQGASNRVEDLFHNWEKLDPETRENAVDMIAWLLRTAVKLIRQMVDRPDAPKGAPTVSWGEDIRHVVGWWEGEKKATERKPARRSAKPVNFGTPPGYFFEPVKLKKASMVINLKGGPLRDRYYIIPLRDELRVFTEHLPHHPLDSVTIDSASKQLLGHSQPKPSG